MFAKVVIIGRPNVGKSSFFNMYTGHKIAVVADEPGTTRDVSEYEFFDEENNISYILSDSGGLDFGSDDKFSEDIVERTTTAIQESDVLLWILEYDKFTKQDEKILQILKRKEAKNVIVIANKADNERKVMEAMSLAGTGGYDDFFITSVSHHKGFLEIQTRVAKVLKKSGFKRIKDLDEQGVLKLAIVGRPNVGKSSLVNSIVGKNRVMVADFSGTTRDSIDTKIEFEKQKCILIDTAGIRRLSKIGTRNVENWSVMRSQRSITRADIVVVVLDGVEGVTQQDLSIISQVVEEKKGLIVVINKWDLTLEKDPKKGKDMMDRYLGYLRSKLDFLSWVPVIFTTATQKKSVNEVLKKAFEIQVERQKRVKTGIFNTFIEQVVYKHAPTGNKKSHNPKIFYGSQVDVNPPKFLLSVNNPDEFHFSYTRYFENRIRENFGFEGTPIILEMRGKERRYAKQKTHRKPRDVDLKK